MVQVLHLPVTLLQEKTVCSENSLPMHRARTLLPEFVLRCTFPKWKKNSRGICTVQRCMQDSGDSLQRHAGHGVYRRARQTVHAADTYGKRTAKAALKIACDLVDEGMRTEEEAVAMIDPRNLDSLLHPQFDADALKKATPMGKALGASPELHVVRSYLPLTML